MSERVGRYLCRRPTPTEHDIVQHEIELIGTDFHAWQRDVTEADGTRGGRERCDEDHTRKASAELPGDRGRQEGVAEVLQEAWLQGDLTRIWIDKQIIDDATDALAQGIGQGIVAERFEQGEHLVQESIHQFRVLFAQKRAG